MTVLATKFGLNLFEFMAVMIIQSIPRIFVLFSEIWADSPALSANKQVINLGLLTACCSVSVWWMRVDMDSPLSSILEVSTDLKRIQTPQSSLWDFWADQTFTTSWSGGRDQVWAQVQASPCHLAIIPKVCSRRQSKVLTAKSMAELLGVCSCTAWAGQTGKHRNRVFPSLLQLLLAATCPLEENGLPLTQSESQKGLNAFKFWASTSHFFFMLNEICNRISHQSSAQCLPLLLSIFQSFIGHWLAIWQNNKAACLK